MKKNDEETDDMVLRTATEWVDKIHQDKGVEGVKQLAVDLLVCEGSEVMGLLDRFLKEYREKAALDRSTQGINGPSAFTT